MEGLTSSAPDINVSKSLKQILPNPNGLMLIMDDLIHLNIYTSAHYFLPLIYGSFLKTSKSLFLWGATALYFVE